jgi:hypothetical protein
MIDGSDVLPLAFACAMLACSSSSSSDGGSTGVDSGANDAEGGGLIDVGPEIGCPAAASVIAGGACEGSATCLGVEHCTLCFHDTYAKITPQCQCTGGKWTCGVYDCPPGSPGTFSDSSCTTPTGGPPDASTDGSDADDTSDGG